MINYEFFEDGKFLLSKYYGIIDKSTMLAYIDFIRNLKRPVQITKILSDFQDAKITFSVEDLQEIATKRSILTSGLNKTMTIYLVNNQTDTAISTLFALDYSNSNTSFGICSTLECCISKLYLTLNVRELEEKLRNLKNSFTFPK